MSEQEVQQGFDLLLFGGTGDLTMRMLIPSLFEAHQAGSLTPKGKIWGLSRKALNKEEYQKIVDEDLPKFCPDYVQADAKTKQTFLARLDYISCDAKKPEDFKKLVSAVGKDDGRVKIVYLATTPTLFVDICANLSKVGLSGADTRVVLEKPLGVDLASNREINDAVGDYFEEHQIYRIDHYLGKESVQNLLMLRFANVTFEPLWRREWISSVQITIAESVGIGTRGAFYDNIGALRDMVQNHLIQLLCMVAMEPPANREPTSIQEEKLKVLKALKPFTPETVASDVIRGQYKRGVVNGKAVKAFHEEANIAPDSQTETFVALRTEIMNWRWQGVPFYLRTGKCMQDKLAEIVVKFREVPLKLFPMPLGEYHGNSLMIRLQPDEGMKLKLFAKKPGNFMNAQSAALNLDFDKVFDERRSSAYERLILDVIKGDQTLFVSRKEQEVAWQWVAPIMQYWQETDVPPKTYSAGSWGPAASSALLARDGQYWHEEE